MFRLASITCDKGAIPKCMMQPDNLAYFIFEKCIHVLAVEKFGEYGLDTFIIL